jgi:O-methyltransferase
VLGIAVSGAAGRHRAADRAGKEVSRVMLIPLKRTILRACQIAGYEITHRRIREAPSSDDAPPASLEPSPETPPAESTDAVPPAPTDPTPPDYQLLMAQQELMAKLADLDAAAKPHIEAVRPFTMTSIERLFDLYKSVEYLVKAGVPGDLLECGVWRGGSMMLVARTLLSLGDTSRTLFLLDTYEGHPKPDAEKDRDLWGNNPLNEWVNHRITDETSDWAYVSIDEVRSNMESTGYPMKKVVLVKGMVEKTAATVPPVPLSLLRLDTDWYASAKAGLETFWPRLSRKGILIIDDYGHYRGQRQAVDEYFAATPVKLNRIDYSCRTILKTD